jgi:hypothetical protein
LVEVYWECSDILKAWQANINAPDNARYENFIDKSFNIILKNKNFNYK